MKNLVHLQDFQAVLLINPKQSDFTDRQHYICVLLTRRSFIFQHCICLLLTRQSFISQDRSAHCDTSCLLSFVIGVLLLFFCIQIDWATCICLFILTCVHAALACCISCPQGQMSLFVVVVCDKIPETRVCFVFTHLQRRKTPAAILQLCYLLNVRF